jgi:hypothetical protein
VAPLILTFLYAIGGAMVAGGIYVIAHGVFPAWVKGALLWPLITSRDRDHSGLGVGVVRRRGAGVQLRAVCARARHRRPGVLAGVGVAAGLLLFVYSTWISRRRSAGSLPPRP